MASVENIESRMKAIIFMDSVYVNGTITKYKNLFIESSARPHIPVLKVLGQVESMNHCHSSIFNECFAFKPYIGIKQQRV